MNASLAYELSNDSFTASLDRLVTLGWGLDGVLRAGVPGAVVELGCYTGAASVWLAEILHTAARTGTDRCGGPRPLVLFDSFAGLPAPGPRDRDATRAAGGPVWAQEATQGDLATTADRVRARFTAHGLPQPQIVAGWFDGSLDQLPEEIAFADLYESTLTGLQALWPRLSPGGLLVIDDYADPRRDARAWAGQPGIKNACDDFLAELDLPAETVAVVPGDRPFQAIGYLHKPTAPAAGHPAPAADSTTPPGSPRPAEPPTRHRPTDALDTNATSTTEPPAAP